MNRVPTILALTFLTAFAALSASAHIEPGVWVGKSASGKECALEVFEQTFDRDVHHPLNERIRVRVNGDEFRIYHPREIDLRKNVVKFNHDRFESVLPTGVGSNALVIDMLHAKDFEGPTGFRWIEDNWKTKASRSLTCLGLKHR